MAMQLSEAGHLFSAPARRMQGWRGQGVQLTTLFAKVTPAVVVTTDAAAGMGGQIGRAAFAAFAVRVLSAAIAYLTQVVLARWMGGAEYGIFVWVWVWVLILGGMSSLGLQVSLIRYVPQYLERQQFGLLAGVLRAGRVIPVAVATAVAVLTVGALALWGGALQPQYRLPLYFALACLPLYALTDVQDGIGRSRAWIGIGLVPPYILRPVLILAGMIAAHFAGLPMLASTAAAAALVATWSTGLIQFALLQGRLGRETVGARLSYDFSEWFATSLPIWFIAGCELMLQNLDVLVVTRYVDPASVGIYFAALKSIGLVAFVNYAVGSAIAGRLSELNARGDRPGIERAVRDGARWTFWPSLLGAAVLLVIGKPLLAIFGAEFTAGYPLMFVLVVGLVARSAVGPAEFVLRMLSQQRLCAAVYGVTAIIDLTLSLSLTPTYGAMGAAVANAASLTLMALMFYILARRRLGFDVSAFARAH